MVKRITLTACLVLAAASLSADWKLPQPEGHAPNGWSKKESAWTPKRGNPYRDNGASWYVFVQNHPDAPMNAPFQFMIPGVVFNYNMAWLFKGAASTAFYAEGCRLTGFAGQGGGISPAAGLLFQLDKEGKHSVRIAGKIFVAAPSVGHARVQIYLFHAENKQTTLLKEFKLNRKVPNANGNYPETFEWNGDIAFSKITTLVFRLQSVSPGPVSCGVSRVTFSEFTVN